MAGPEGPGFFGGAVAVAALESRARNVRAESVGRGGNGSESRSQWSEAAHSEHGSTVAGVVGIGAVVYVRGANGDETSVPGTV